MADIDLSDPRLQSAGFGEFGRFSPHEEEGEVGDCFYNWTAEELASWFAFERQGMSAGEWREAGFPITTIYDDDRGDFVIPGVDEELYPRIAAVSMDWSWSFFFANESVAHKVAATGGACGEDALRER